MAGGFCVFGLLAQAEVKISQVVVDGQPREIHEGSAQATINDHPLRLSSAAHTVQFDFTEGDDDGRPTSRLRHKLDGRDDSWRDLPNLMRVLVRFRDTDARLVGGSAEFYIQGESPGWRGSVESSEFHPRREQVIVPELAVDAQIAFVTHGGEIGIGQIGIDAVRVVVEPREGGPAKEFDLGITDGTNLTDPMGTPKNWMRIESTKLELARLGMRLTPNPHPILVLDDNSPEHYGNWSLVPEKAVPVRPGDRLTLEWLNAFSIGRCGPDQATYKQLKPGNYTFRVAKAAANGTLTGDEVSLPIVVIAPMVLRWEFWMVLVALAGGALIWGYQILAHRRMKLRLAEVERQQVLEHERARIARDLHDDIGAGLTEIAMQSDWVRRDLAAGPTEETQHRINRVCQSAMELTRNVDEIVWAMNPANDTLDRFTNYLMQSTKQFLDAADLRVRFDIPSDLPGAVLPGKIRHALSLTVREALNNLVKHSRSDLVRIILRLEDGQVRIAIEDNGSGFTREQVGAEGTHEGLESMRRRMEDIGGQFLLETPPDGGARVVFLAPLPIGP